MNLVYLLSVVLFIPSVWFLLRPLSHADGDQSGSEQWHQFNLVRDRLLSQIRELEQQAADGVIDESIVDDERLRLESELAPILKQLDGLSTKIDDKFRQVISKPRQRIWLIAAVLFLLPLTVAVYTINGLDVFRGLYAQKPPVGADAMPPFVMEMVARLEKRLQKSPDDAQGWSRLGRAYTVLRRLEEAKGAYEQAYKLAPNDKDIVAAYAGFLYQLNPHQTRGEVRDIYSRLRKLEPGHPGVMWFFGVVAYDEGNFAGALKQWKRLYKFLPPDSGARRSVDKAITQAQTELDKARQSK